MILLLCYKQHHKYISLYCFSTAYSCMLVWHSSKMKLLYVFFCSFALLLFCSLVPFFSFNVWALINWDLIFVVTAYDMSCVVWTDIAYIWELLDIAKPVVISCYLFGWQVCWSWCSACKILIPSSQKKGLLVMRHFLVAIWHALKNYLWDYVLNWLIKQLRHSTILVTLDGIEP